MALRKLLEVLNRRKLLISGLFVTILGATAVVVALMPRQYESRMKVLVKNDRTDPVVTADRRDGSVVRGVVGESEIYSEIQLLTSEDLLEQVVLRCELYKPYLKEGESFSPKSPAIERALRALKGDLEVSQARKSNLIQLKYVARSPELSVSVLRNLTELYLEEHLRVHRNPGLYEFFASEANRYQGKLSAAQSNLAAIRRRTDVLTLEPQVDMIVRRVADTEAAYQEATTALAEAQEREASIRRQLSALPGRIVTQTRTIPNQYSSERLQTMIAELRNKRTQLLTKFKDDDRLVQESDQQIRDTREALQASLQMAATEQVSDNNPLAQGLEGNLAQAVLVSRGLEARRTSLSRQLREYRARMAQLGSAIPAYEDAKREIAPAEENYLLFKKKAEEARITDSLDSQGMLNVSIAEAPTRPRLPSKPNLLLNFGMGLALACLVSLGTALSLE